MRFFEDFLTTALSEALAGAGGQVKAQHVDSLDVDGDISIQPDITWWRDGACAAIVDAKYKSLATGGLRNPDAYQMLAYCTAMRQPVGFLVYAKDSGEQPARHEIRNSACEIRVRTIDLEGTPDVLLHRVKQLADEICACAAVSAVAA